MPPKRSIILPKSDVIKALANKKNSSINPKATYLEQFKIYLQNKDTATKTNKQKLLRILDNMFGNFETDITVKTILPAINKIKVTNPRANSKPENDFNNPENDYISISDKELLLNICAAWKKGKLLSDNLQHVLHETKLQEEEPAQPQCATKINLANKLTKERPPITTIETSQEERDEWEAKFPKLLENFPANENPLPVPNSQTAEEIERRKSDFEKKMAAIKQEEAEQLARLQNDMLTKQAAQYAQDLELLGPRQRPVTVPLQPHECEYIEAVRKKDLLELTKVYEKSLNGDPITAAKALSVRADIIVASAFELIAGDKAFNVINLGIAHSYLDDALLKRAGAERIIENFIKTRNNLENSEGNVNEVDAILAQIWPIFQQAYVDNANSISNLVEKIQKKITKENDRYQHILEQGQLKHKIDPSLWKHMTWEEKEALRSEKTQSYILLQNEKTRFIDLENKAKNGIHSTSVKIANLPNTVTLQENNDQETKLLALQEKTSLAALKVQRGTTKMERYNY